MLASKIDKTPWGPWVVLPCFTKMWPNEMVQSFCNGGIVWIMPMRTRHVEFYTIWILKAQLMAKVTVAPCYTVKLNIKHFTHGPLTMEYN